LQGTNVIELPDVSRVSPVGFSTVVSLPTSGQNGSAVRINGGTLIEQDSLSSNSKEENGATPNDSRGFNSFLYKNFFPQYTYTQKGISLPLTTPVYIIASLRSEIKSGALYHIFV